jgi:hypothetical protein
MVLYLCVLSVFSLHRESLNLILIDEPLPEVVLSHAMCWGCRPEALHAEGPPALSHLLSSAGTKEMQVRGLLGVVRL